MAAKSAPITTLNRHKNHQSLFSFASKGSSSTFHYRGHFLRLNKSPRSLSFSFSSSSASSSPTPHWPVARVTTVPLEFAASPPPEFDLRREISRLKALRSRLAECEGLEKRLRVVGGDRRVKEFFNSARNGFSRVLDSMNLSSYELFLLKCLVAAGQEHVLDFGFEFADDGGFESARGSLKSALYALVGMIEKLDVNGGNGGFENRIGLSLNDEDIGDLRKLLKILAEVEQFYDCIGGIIG